MADKGKDKIVEPEVQAFTSEEWHRVDEEVMALGCWRCQEREDLYHWKERIKSIRYNADIVVELLEEKWETILSGREFARYIEARRLARGSQAQSVLPSSSSTPVTGSGSSTVVDITPPPSVSAPVVPRILDMGVEEDPEEDPVEEPEADDDIMMWEEEPAVPEVIEISDDSDIEFEATRVEELEQLLAPMEEGDPEEEEPMRLAVEEEAEDPDEILEDSSSSEDGSDDDPDFVLATYHERADRRDRILP